MTLTIYAIIFTVLGILLFISAVRRIRKRQIISATGRGVFSIAIFGAATLCFSLGMNLYTYQRLTAQKIIANIYITKADNDAFNVKLHLTDGRKFNYKMVGDGWAFSAKVIVWKPQASLIGLDPVFRLDGIENHYENKDPVTIKTITSYKLTDKPGLEAVDLFKKYQNWLPWLHDSFGSAVYKQFKHNAHHKVIITTTGLKLETSQQEENSSNQDLAE